jgi:MscS family membrane protein
MWERIRIGIAAILLFVAVMIVAQAVSAQEAAPAAPLPDGRDSPRATLFGFLEAMDEIVGNEIAPIDIPATRARALACLDSSEFSESWRKSKEWISARAVYEVFEYAGRPRPDQVPDAVRIRDATSWTYATANGDLELVRSDGGWHFTSDTIVGAEKIVGLYESQGAKKIQRDTVGDRVRAEFPALARRALFLEHWQWLGLVLLALLAWLAQRVVAYIVATLIGGVLGRRGWLEGAAEAARNAGRPAGLFAVAALLAFLGPLLELPVSPTDLHKWVTVIVAKLFASLGAVLILYRLADVAAAHMAGAAEQTESKLDDQLVPLIRKSLKILVTVGGALFILDNLEADIWSLLAGAGVAGVAFAFAAQDTIKNLFGSLTVFLDRPFHVGDWVQMAGVEGTVEEVGFRSTRVRTFYNSLVSVPNSKLVDGIVDNMGMRQYRRFKTTIGIRYDTPPQRIEAFCHGIRQIVRTNTNMRQDYFEVYLHNWGPSSLDILVYVFFVVPDWDAELRERQNFMIEVIRLARELNVGFAFPTRTLELEATPEHPAKAQQRRTADELAEVTERFTGEGDLARPSGTPRFLPERRGSADEEARGGA